MLRSAAALAVIAITLAVPPASASASDVHLSYAGNDEYYVTFSSPQPLADPIVQWPGGSATAQAWPHPTADNDSIYIAKIPARPALDYTIQGRTFHAQAPPAVGATTRVAFVADWGRSEDSYNVLDRILASKPDLVIVGGDISYANGRPGKWDEWFARVEPLASRVPMMTAYGNHEALCQDSAGNLFVCAHEGDEYAEHFHMTNGDAHDYAFDWGAARFVALDTEAYHLDPGAPVPFSTDARAQEAFLKSALSGAPASSPWRIAFFHRSLFSSNAGQDEPDAVARDALQPILDAGGVNLVLSGHVHAYERSHPMHGVVYVDSGGGGRSLYSEWSATQPNWSATRSAEFEFVLLDISQSKMDVKALRADGSVLDAFTITRAGIQEDSGHTLHVPDAPVFAALAVGALVARVTLSRRP